MKSQHRRSRHLSLRAALVLLISACVLSLSVNGAGAAGISFLDPFSALFGVSGSSGLALNETTLRAPNIFFDNSYFALSPGTPLTQNWTDPALITVSDDWSGVPSINGYRGDDATAGTGVDPQTFIADLSGVLDVNANQTNPDVYETGGVAEFDTLADPVVALQGSGTADFPNLDIRVNTLGCTSPTNSGTISYNVRDIDGSADDAIQQVALQYRVGASGDYTNIAAGYVADATTAAPTGRGAR